MTEPEAAVKSRQICTIKVVSHDGALWFESEGVRFDKLAAFQEFEGGTLTVMRRGVVFDKTSEIGEYGTHAACTCFAGLQKLFPADQRGWAISGVNPEEFQDGDELSLEVIADQTFSLVALLRRSLWFRRAADDAFAEAGGEMTLGKLCEQIVAKGPPAAAQVKDLTELRFREKR